MGRTEDFMSAQMLIQLTLWTFAIAMIVLAGIQVIRNYR